MKRYIWLVLKKYEFKRIFRNWNVNIFCELLCILSSLWIQNILKSQTYDKKRNHELKNDYFVTFYIAKIDIRLCNVEAQT